MLIYLSILLLLTILYILILYLSIKEHIKQPAYLPARIRYEQTTSPSPGTGTLNFTVKASAFS